MWLRVPLQAEGSGLRGLRVLREAEGMFSLGNVG